MKVIDFIHLLLDKPELHHLELETPHGNKPVDVERKDTPTGREAWTSNRPRAILILNDR